MVSQLCNCGMRSTRQSCGRSQNCSFSRFKRAAWHFAYQHLRSKSIIISSENPVLVTCWAEWRKPGEAVWCLTPEVLSDAQSQAIFGPLNNAWVVEDNTGQDHPLAPHHRLVCRLLREPRCPHWRDRTENRDWKKKREKVRDFLTFSLRTY